MKRILGAIFFALLVAGSPVQAQTADQLNDREAFQRELRELITKVETSEDPEIFAAYAILNTLLGSSLSGQTGELFEHTATFKLKIKNAKTQ